jgi:hypothetical protein
MILYISEKPPLSTAAIILTILVGIRFIFNGLNLLVYFDLITLLFVVGYGVSLAGLIQRQQYGAIAAMIVGIGDILLAFFYLAIFALDPSLLISALVVDAVIAILGYITFESLNKQKKGTYSRYYQPSNRPMENQTTYYSERTSWDTQERSGICNNCGTKNDSNSKFCYNCGFKLE